MSTSGQRLQTFLESLGFHGFEHDDQDVVHKVRFHDPSAIPSEVHAKAFHLTEECITRDAWALRDATVAISTIIRQFHRGAACQGRVWRARVRVTGDRPVVIIKHFHNRFPMPGHYRVHLMEVVGDSQTINFTVAAPQRGIVYCWDIFAPRHELEEALGEEVQFETEPLMPYLEE